MPTHHPDEHQLDEHRVIVYRSLNGRSVEIAVALFDTSANAHDWADEALRHYRDRDAISIFTADIYPI